MPFAIEIRELYKMYKGAWAPALDGFSFTVKEHTISGLLGPNGAGKTTCISILCGLVQAGGGRATVFGEDCGKDAESVRRKIGVVPQQIALFGNLSAIENFMYVGRLYGLPDAVIKQRSTALLQRLGLEKHADKRVGRYSGGMKRRANIIASLLHEPELLILDEPTAGVDVQSRTMIIEFLQEYHKLDKTILYTSHLLDEAQQLCDEVAIIDEGKLITTGTPGELISRTKDAKRLEDVFLHYTGHGVRD